MAMVPTASMVGKAAGTGFGSSFLTGAGAGIGSAVGSAFGRGGDGYNTYRSHQRKLWKQQSKAQRRHAESYYTSLVKGLNKAGLHPLAALGVSPAGQSVTAPMAGPSTQSPLGSAIGEGIRTAGRHAMDREARAHGRVVAGLQLEEQRLRNDYIREQIEASRQKRMQQAVNVTNPVTTLSELQAGLKGRHPDKIDFNVRKAKPYEHAPGNTGYNLFGAFPIKQRPGKLTAEGAQQAGGEPLEWLYSLPSVVQDIGYTLDSLYRNPDGTMKKGSNWYEQPHSEDYSP